MMMENGMTGITVKKSELLEKLKENREAHAATFKEAWKGYKKAAELAFIRALRDVRRHDKVQQTLDLVEPQDHTSDYDRVIKMLEMSTKDDIFITEREFSHFVMDDWDWKDAFATSTQGYLVAKVKH